MCSDKTVILLTGPSAAGKSTFAENASKTLGVGAVNIDHKVMGPMHRLARFTGLPAIDQYWSWRPALDGKLDLDRLIRLYHQNMIAMNWNKSVIILEGYSYMRDFFRYQAKLGLDELPIKIDTILVRLRPSNEEIAQRMNARSTRLNQPTKDSKQVVKRFFGQDDHWQDPSSDYMPHKILDDEGVTRLLEELLEKHNETSIDR